MKKNNKITDENISLPIVLEEFNDIELLEIVNELQKETFSEDSIIRKLAKQYFGGDSLTQIMFVALKVLPVVSKRMKCYSPHIPIENKTLKHNESQAIGNNEKTQEKCVCGRREDAILHEDYLEMINDNPPMMSFDRPSEF